MSFNSLLPLLIVFSALLPGLVIFCIDEQRVLLRRLFNIGSNILCLTLIALLISGVYSGDTFETRLSLLPGMDLVLHADSLSLLFVALSGLLWLVTTLYAIGYLEGSENRSRFFGFFSLCVGATLGVALAGNLITFLIFYELLTLTTYPLVVHKGNPASIRAGRIYLTYTMIGGALLLAGVVWLKALAGPLDFTTTGILSGLPQLDPDHLKIIFALLIAGLGVKAALFPFHGWLPIAMAAPAPVSSLLHAVAVVKAGAFGIIRVVYDVYGIEFSRDLGLTLFLAVIAAFTIVYGSMRALFQDDLKKRLAYSTVSQVSYIALGTAIAGPIATIGGMVHLVHQGLMKITMFFCAGNLAETVGIYKVSQMNGIGYRMPLTMGAFTIVALGMIGLPPIAGFVSKWFLGTGAIEVGAYWVLGVLAVSSLLNALYFLPILHAAWFKTASRSSDSNWPAQQGRIETRWLLLLPPLITAALATLAGIFASTLVSPLSWAELIAVREYGQELVMAIEPVVMPLPQLWWAIITPLILAIGLLASGLLVPGLQKDFLQKGLARFSPWATVPALLVALWSAHGTNAVPWLFFGSTLTLDSNSQVMLLLAASLWLITGLYGRDYLRNDPHIVRYSFFFLMCMAGSFGLVLAQDLFGFITFFTLMSIAAYGLVVHSGSEEAFKAGRTYMQWVIIGEVILFAALVGLAISSGNDSLLEIDKAQQPLWVSWLLLIGFGVKAGLLGLHFWLPRAHPVAPIPASALLSGLMVKAGILGWWRFLPLGEVALVEPGFILIALGLTGTFLAIVAGIFQQNPKTVLAYSTISQMGILAAGVGVGLQQPMLWPLLSSALLIYVVHHGLAKAALFLAVGFAPLLATASKHSRWCLWLATVVPALALTGLPLTSGALAKSALKNTVVDVDWLVNILPITAIGTTLLMLRFIDLLRLSASTSNQATPLGRLSKIAYGALLSLVISMVYCLPQAELFIAYAFSYQSLWNALWPLALGVFIYLASRSYLVNISSIPAGDFIVLIESAYLALKGITTKRGQVAINYVHRIEMSITQKNPLSRSFELANVAMTHLQPGILVIGVLVLVALTLVINGIF